MLVNIIHHDDKIRCDKTACKKRESASPECEQFYLLSVQGVWSSFGLAYFEACNAVIGYFCSIVDVLLHLEEATPVSLSGFTSV